jgi:hypothetical protein
MVASTTVGTAGDEATPSGDAMVAGRSLDEWSERLFPDVSMRVTDAYDEDSPYSRAVQVPSCHHALCAAALVLCCARAAACQAVATLSLQAGAVGVPLLDVRQLGVHVFAGCGGEGGHCGSQQCGRAAGAGGQPQPRRC